MSSKIFPRLSFFIFMMIFLFMCLDQFSAPAAEINLDFKNSSNKVRILFFSKSYLGGNIFTLNNPKRLVVDFKSKKSIKSNFKKITLLNDYRIGKLEGGGTRIVFDLEKKLKKFSYTPVIFEFNKNYSLIIDLYFEKYSTPKKTIVIDPGHGGRDPGASRGNLKEKNITLLASKYLAQLLRNKGYEVYLTRNNDRFIRLSNRVKFARKKSADLFISIHADSTYNKNTRGMSIYSLSEKASDILSQSLAESENKVDLIGGVDLEEVEKEVSDILIDLTRRETKNSSIEFAQLFIKYSKNSDINLLTRPHRQAGFAVLKAPDVPSVLIEMGFISNRQDYNLLMNEEYRRGIMKHLSNVVDQYLEKR